MSQKINIKLVLILCLSGLILISAGLLFVYPGFLRPSYGLSALPNHRLTGQKANSLAAKLAGEDAALEQAFRQKFLKNLVVSGEETDNQVVLAGYLLDDHGKEKEQNEILLSNQLLWGRYLANKGKRSDFDSWLRGIKDHFILDQGWALKLNLRGELLQKTDVGWPYDLALADILLTVYNKQPSQKILSELKTVMDRSYPYFMDSQSMPNLDLKVERIFYPESSVQSEPTPNPELYDPFKEARFIRLSDINLFVLESFSLIDETWQPVFERWQGLIENSKTESTPFYPLGIMPNLQDYVSTGSQAFLTLTIDNVKLLYTAPSQASDQAYTACRAFYKQSILDGGGLATAYHINSLKAMTDEPDLSSLALLTDYFKLKRQAEYPDTDSLLQGIRALVEVNRYKDKLSDLDEFYFRPTAGDHILNFQAEDQILLMTAGLTD